MRRDYRTAVEARKEVLRKKTRTRKTRSGRPSHCRQRYRDFPGSGSGYMIGKSRTMEGNLMIYSSTRRWMGRSMGMASYHPFISALIRREGRKCVRKYIKCAVTGQIFRSRSGYSLGYGKWHIV